MSHHTLKGHLEAQLPPHRNEQCGGTPGPHMHPQNSTHATRASVFSLAYNTRKQEPTGGGILVPRLHQERAPTCWPGGIQLHQSQQPCSDTILSAPPSAGSLRTTIGAPVLPRAQRHAECPLPGHPGFPPEPGPHQGRQWVLQTSRLAASLASGAHSWGSICRAGLPGPDDRPLFLGRPLGTWPSPHKKLVIQV